MTDALFGKNWVMDPGSSMMMTATAPDSETRRYDEIPNGYSLKVDGSRGGVPYTWGYTALYDGKDHSVHGRTDADAIEAYRLSDRMTIGFFKKKGDVGVLYQRKVRQDGALEVLMAGKHDDGTAYWDVIVYK